VKPEHYKSSTDRPFHIPVDNAFAVLSCRAPSFTRLLKVLARQREYMAV
jgi:hypothetical protein